jgi:hypothetical protein
MQQDTTHRQRPALSHTGELLAWAAGSIQDAARATLQRAIDGFKARSERAGLTRAQIHAYDAAARERTRTEPGRVPPLLARDGGLAKRKPSGQRIGMRYRRDGTIDPRWPGFYVVELAPATGNRRTRRHEAKLDRKAR